MPCYRVLFCRKKHGTTGALNRTGVLLDHITITECGNKEARKAIMNKKALHFEDALQYYAALHATCNCMVTNDTADFYYADKIEIIAPELFLMQYVK